MTCFHKFTGSDWGVFYGNALMFATCAFYLAWWFLAFSPSGGGHNSFTSFLITAAIVTGMASIIVLSLGIGFMPRAGKGIPVAAILLGALALYAISLSITKTVFHRPVTSELPVMFMWAAVEFAAIAALRRSGRFEISQTVMLAVLVTLATLVGLVCYVLYYRLDGAAGFLDGLIPLAMDAVVVAIFLSVQATS